MGAEDTAEYSSLPGGASPNVKNFTKVSFIPLTFLIFYGVSGGPFGVEDTVRAAGPFLALIGFLIFPFIWSIIESLITAELSTMFPENGGYVVWVSTTFGPYWGFQLGWVKWMSGVVDNALYPGLFLDYIKSAVPALANGLPRTIAILVLIIALTYLNYRGLTIVGWFATVLAIFTLLPFGIMGLVALPKLEPSRCELYGRGSRKSWENTSKGFILRTSFSCLELFFSTGAVPLHRDLWSDGYFSDIAKIIGGVWLRFWVQGASAVSNMGMFLAEMSGDSFQPLGMAERGMLPDFFAKRSRYGTPLIGILFSASGVVFLSYLNFQEIVAAENFLYCFGMMCGIYSFCEVKDKISSSMKTL
ncbi:hypothetical protein K7X08_008657 [Anisodus acutangulus]|uniref:Uncharacterized protein n=1 Tax=Anisodus acutangulus TaxID=402998 RepID=A0A9Q1N284_9SOLA|nr:hypothetical protein K7X08_008657 [Anisodus acutangulus]